MATGEPSRKIDGVFLKELDIDDTLIGETLLVLEKNGFLNVRTLCSLSLKDELKDLQAENDKGEKVTLKAGTVGVLWAFVEKQRALENPRAGVGVVPVVPLKKASKEKYGVPAFALFLANQLEVERARGEIKTRSKRLRQLEPSDRHFELVSNLNGKIDSRRSLFFRDELCNAVDEICYWLVDPNHRAKQLILGGSRGTGKSVVGMLSAIRLAAEGQLVLYSMLGISMLMLTDVLSAEKRSDLNLLLASYGLSSLEKETGVFVFDMELASARSMYNSLFNSEECVVIEDIGDSPLHPQVTASMATRLIVTSPNATKLKEIRRYPGLTTLILPTWTKEEILAIDTPGVQKEIILSRFARFGGIPRWVCDASPGEAERFQDEQISNLSIEILSKVALSREYGQLPSQVDKVDQTKSTDLIFRLEPQGNWPKPSVQERCAKVLFCSNYVADALAEQFVENQEQEVRAWVAAAAGGSMLASYRGYFLEASVHKALRKGTAKMTITNLSGSKRTSVTTTPEFKFDETVRYHHVSEKLKVGVYYQPTRTNEPTVDSFALVERAFVEVWLPSHPALDDEKASHFIVFFQITVAKDEHVVDGTELRKLQELAKTSLSANSLPPMALVFVTYASGLNKVQIVTYKSKERPKDPSEHTEEGEIKSEAKKAKPGGEPKREKNRVAFANQEQFVQFRAVVCDDLQTMFEKCKVEKARMESEIMAADNGEMSLDTPVHTEEV